MGETAWLREADIFMSSVMAVLKILLIAFVGVLLKRFEILNNAAASSLSKMIFFLLTPCLLLNEIIHSVSIGELSNLVVIVVISSVNIFLCFGMAIGFGLAVDLVGRLWKERTDNDDQRHIASEISRRAIVQVVTFGNASSIPIGIVSSLFQGDDEKLKMSISYISLYIASTNFLLYSLGLWYMKPRSLPPKPVPVLSSDQSPNVSSGVEEEKDAVTIELSSFSDPNTTSQDQEQKDDLGDSMTIITLNIQEEEEGMGREEEAVKEEERQEPQKRKWGRADLLSFTKLIFTPTTLAIIVALVIALIPWFKNLFVSQNHPHPDSPPSTVGEWFHQSPAFNPPLGFLMNSIQTLSNASVPLILISLGLNLSDGPKSASLSKFDLTSSTFLRLFINPLIGMAMVSIAEYWNLIGNDIMELVILIQCATPASISLIVVSDMAGHGSKEISTFLFYQYICSIFSITFFLSIFLSFFTPLV